ncbi:MAG: excisionase family DNA-binding protein [Bacteroidota bacterium]|jgi:excisionase family DNA binding protein
MTKLNKKTHYTVKEIADILGISRIAVFNKIKNKQIRAEMVGKTYIVDANELRGIFANELDNKQKEKIEESVARFVKEYGQTLKLLGLE